MKNLIKKTWFRKLIYLLLFFILYSLILWICYIIFNYITKDYNFHERLKRWGESWVFINLAEKILISLVLYLIPFWIVYMYGIRNYIKMNADKLYKLGIINMTILLTTTCFILPVFKGAIAFGFTNGYFGSVFAMTSVFTVPYILKALSLHKLLMEYEDKTDEIQVNTHM